VDTQNKGHKPNSLINETSPYLLQHAYNPVQWYAWNKEALDRSKKENKPIFLSIGYSSCHWCHVMAHESFEDEGIARIMNENYINIKVDKGVVYIDISDKLLFKSGSYDITENAKQVLGKVAAVLKAQPDIEFMVEGHTDNVGFSKGVLIDNWDLSVKRSTSVVRILQNQYGLDPAKIAAAGRSEYKPVADNSTAEGKAANRRTRIVILPQLDQFFKLLETKKQ